MDLFFPMYVGWLWIPWTVNPPAARKLTKANAWRQYKELRSLFGRHSAVVNRAFAKVNHINYQLCYFIINNRGEYEQGLVNKYAD